MDEQVRKGRAIFVWGAVLLMLPWLALLFAQMADHSLRLSSILAALIMGGLLVGIAFRSVVCRVLLTFLLCLRLVVGGFLLVDAGVLNAWTSVMAAGVLIQLIGLVILYLPSVDAWLRTP